MTIHEETVEIVYPIFWNIELRVVNSNIQLQQNFNLWELNFCKCDDLSSKIIKARRISTQTVNLSHRVIGPGKLETAVDHLSFNQAALACVTADTNTISQELKAAAGIPIKGDSRVYKSETSSSNIFPVHQGTENISLTSKILVKNNTQNPLKAALGIYPPRFEATNEASPSEPNCFNPIFFLAQPNSAEDQNYILLGETIYTTSQQRFMVWAISPPIDPQLEAKSVIQPHLLQAVSDAYVIEDDEWAENWHTLRVHQDGDHGVRDNYMEYWVDTIPIGKSHLEKTSFAFWNKPTTFYIGGFPYTDDADTPKMHYLTGKIAHLFFDPNDWCGSC